MIVKFKNPHPGIGGAVMALPTVVKEYLESIDGFSGPINGVIGKIAMAAPDGYWVSVRQDKGWILLRSPDYDPSALVSKWKLIEFEEVDS